MASYIKPLINQLFLAFFAINIKYRILDCRKLNKKRTKLNGVDRENLHFVLRNSLNQCIVVLQEKKKHMNRNKLVASPREKRISNEHQKENCLYMFSRFRSISIHRNLLYRLVYLILFIDVYLLIGQRNRIDYNQLPYAFVLNN